MEDALGSGKAWLPLSNSVAAWNLRQEHEALRAEVSPFTASSMC